MANCVGIIDSGYRGDLIGKFDIYHIYGILDTVRHLPVLLMKLNHSTDLHKYVPVILDHLKLKLLMNYHNLS